MFRVTTPNGLEVVCETVDDLLALENRLGKTKSNRPRSSQSPKHTKPVLSPEDTKLVVKTLKTLKDAGSNGATAADLMKALGLKEQQALGTVFVKLNRALRSLGVDPEAAVLTKETKGGGKVRFSTDVVDDVLNQLQ